MRFQTLCSRLSRYCGTAVLSACVPGIVVSQEAAETNYLKHRSDPVQQICSRALVDFALAQKCRFLSDAASADYERNLNEANVIFQGYVVAQRIVSAPDQAVAYTRSMALGSMRFASLSDCNGSARDAAHTGERTARDFVPLLRELFEAPARKQ